MVQFKTTILKFAKQGEKTGWTYIQIPAALSQKLKPGNKKIFRVKGKLDNYTFKSVALLPLGGGDFIMALNADVRKAIRKRNGDSVLVQLDVDEAPLKLSPELLECMEDDPIARDFFYQLSKSHQNYYSKWIDAAKTQATKAKRIAQAITAFSRKQNFSEMMRSLKNIDQ